MKKLLVVILFVTVTSGLQGQSPNGRRSQSRLVAITNGRLLDGSGRAPIPNAIVVIEGDHIRAAGPRSRVHIPDGAEVVDAGGFVIAPGFIDTHNHSQSGLETDPDATTQVSQGITTIALGQDGSSALPVGEYLSKREKSPIAINVLTF